jgi:hypothetical protein
MAQEGVQISLKTLLLLRENKKSVEEITLKITPVMVVSTGWDNHRRKHSLEF